MIEISESYEMSNWLSHGLVLNIHSFPVHSKPLWKHALLNQLDTNNFILKKIFIR